MTKRTPEMLWWENSFTRIADNRLFLGKEPAEDIAAACGTPLYVYSLARVRENLEPLRQSVSAARSVDFRILYAMKANPHPDILQLLQKDGTGIDAVSPNEAEAALAAGFSRESIFYTGTSVSRDDLHRIFRIGGMTITIDAEEQLEIMQEVKRDFAPDIILPVSIRWNPGIGRGFSPKTVTAGVRSTDGVPIKFGVEETRVIPVMEQAKKMGFRPVGFHQHLGSGWERSDFPDVCDAVEKMISMAAKIHGRSIPLQFLDFGGGFGPRYAEDQDIFPVDEYIRFIDKKMGNQRGLPSVVYLEPGKYLVADAGILLMHVEYVKSGCGSRFVCVNGGTFNTIPRLAIYTKAKHQAVNVSRVQAEKQGPFTIAGNLCESGDVFGCDVMLPEPRRGDILAVLCAGAYCRSMASHFNSRDIPKEIFIENRNEI
ncbi:MAG: diaminopimelate decarboxylase [Acidobacteria bacterium]|nr:diaminopimelate decarboxylase [Acidobacteriota bacterium]MCG2817058.1 diaminopimelate decarboxylase [Candidatus Aminicenantes bacterium]